MSVRCVQVQGAEVPPSGLETGLFPCNPRAGHFLPLCPLGRQTRSTTSLRIELAQTLHPRLNVRGSAPADGTLFANIWKDANNDASAGRSAFLSLIFMNVFLCTIPSKKWNWHETVGVLRRRRNRDEFLWTWCLGAAGASRLGRWTWGRSSGAFCV